MAPLSMLAALVGAAAVVAGYTPNKPGSSGRYPMNAPYDQSFQDGYSILKHLGGYGPYVNRAAYGIGRDPPEGCAVDQVMMLRRHGERYPLVGDSENMLKTLEKLYGSKVSSWSDDLEFLNRWQFFIPDLGYVELESEAGPYSGLLGSYKHGAEYRVRYGHLWDQKPNSTVPMFTSDYERVIQTARKFGVYLATLRKKQTRTDAASQVRAFLAGTIQPRPRSTSFPRAGKWAPTALRHTAQRTMTRACATICRGICRSSTSPRRDWAGRILALSWTPPTCSI